MRETAIFSPRKINTLLLMGLLAILHQNSIAYTDTFARNQQIRPAADIVSKSIILPVIHKKDIRSDHQRIVLDTMHAIDMICIDALKNFYVRYDKPKNRGLSSKSSIILSGNVPKDEFRALFLHEFAHVIDLGCMTGQKDSGASRFRDGKEVIDNDDPSIGFYEISWITETKRRSSALSADFVSGYAETDAFEDFAESVAYYILQPEMFRLRAQTNTSIANKYDWIATNVFPDIPVLAKGRQIWNNSIPWDVTKLPYEWHGNIDVAHANETYISIENY